jgi:N-acetyl-anhydromuramyl-L-alanine amidase AmpD/uncharacterized protein YraI
MQNYTPFGSWRQGFLREAILRAPMRALSTLLLVGLLLASSLLLFAPSAIADDHSESDGSGDDDDDDDDDDDNQDGSGVTTTLSKPTVIWDEAHDNGWQDASRTANEINRIVIHVTQGSYSGAISWFNNKDSGVAAHYTINNHDAPYSSNGRYGDGEITQMVADDDIGYHDASANTNTIGIEHSAYIDPDDKYHVVGGFSDAMYNSSAKLVAWLTETYDIPVNRYFLSGHSEDQNFGGTSSHSDPGPDWDWDRYLELVKSHRNIDNGAECELIIKVEEQVSIRSGPSADHSAVGEADAGEVYWASRKVVRDDETWYRIAYNAGESAWVNSDSVTVLGSGQILDVVLDDPYDWLNVRTGQSANYDDVGNVFGGQRFVQAGVDAVACADSSWTCFWYGGEKLWASSAYLRTGLWTDSTPPTEVTGIHLSEITGNLTNNQTPSIRWNHSTDDVGVASYKVRINSVDMTSDPAWVEISSELDTYQPTTLLVDGWYSVEVRALDAAGNWDPTRTTSFEFGIDSTAPAAPTVVSNPTDMQSASELVWSWESDTDDMTGVVATRLQLWGGPDHISNSYDIDGELEQKSITMFVADGNYNWSLSSIDAVRNIGLASTGSFSIEGLPALLPPTLITAPSGFLSADIVSLEWSSTSSVTDCRIWLTFPYDVVQEEEFTCAENGSWTSTQLAEGDYYWYLAVGRSGSWSESAIGMFSIDRSRPLPPTLSNSSTATITEVESTLSSQWMNISWDAGMDLTPVQGYQLELWRNDWPPAPVGVWNLSGSDTSFEYQLPESDTESYFVLLLRQQDSVGLWSDDLRLVITYAPYAEPVVAGVQNSTATSQDGEESSAPQEENDDSTKSTAGIAEGIGILPRNLQIIGYALIVLLVLAMVGNLKRQH